MKKVSELIRNKILEDNDFSMKLAAELEIQQQSVLGLARRNSNKLTLYLAIEFYRKNGFSLEQIFNQPVKSL